MIKIVSITGVISTLAFIYGYGLWLTMKADLCYKRVEIAERALLQASRSEQHKARIYHLIERAQKASFNASTQFHVHRLMERYNAKFNSTPSTYEKALAMD